LERNRILTPEEELAEKLKRQRLQEQSDLELAKEAFGNTKKPLNNCFSVTLLSIIIGPNAKGKMTTFKRMIHMLIMLYVNIQSFHWFRLG
jgi:translation initiation factor 3 subunit J